jgi:hypothetical protein
MSDDIYQAVEEELGDLYQYSSVSSEQGKSGSKEIHISCDKPGTYPKAVE